MTVKEYNITVNKNSDHLYRFILKNIKDEAKAQDIVQDSYEKLWIKKDELVLEKAKSYLFMTAYRTMIDSIRRDKIYTLTNDKNVFDRNHEHEYSDATEVINKAIDTLPFDYKSVILLRDYEGYSYEEIAKITELTESQVKTNIYRARVCLKNYLVKIENVV